MSLEISYEIIIDHILKDLIDLNNRLIHFDTWMYV